MLKKNIHSQVLNSAIFIEECYTNYPFQTNLYGLPKKIIKECLIGYIKEYFSKKEKPKDFEQWIQQTFGEGISKYFMIPYNEKIWTIHPSEMTIDWFFNDGIVPKGDLIKVFKGAIKRKNNKNSIRWYPKNGGIKSLAESYLPHIKSPSLNTQATKILISEKKIKFNNSISVKYDTLINTIPLPEVIDILSDAPKNIKTAAKMLKYNSVMCVNIGVDRNQLSDKHWIYFPEKKYIFSRVYFPMNFSKDMVPKGKSSVSAIITYSNKKPLPKGDLKTRVINDLKKAKIINEKDKIILCETTNIKYGFNLYDHKRKENIETILNYLESNNIHSIGRYGKWEYSGIEHSILESDKLVKKLIKGAKLHE